MLKVLNSKMHMQYLLMADEHAYNMKDYGAVSQVNKFLFDDSEYHEVHHPTKWYFRVYRNFRDYIFKPVFNTYSNVMPVELVEGKVMRELFDMWLNI